jgi:hypothetical protein
VYADENTCITPSDRTALHLLTRSTDNTPEECFSAKYCSEEEGGFVDPTGEHCVDSCFDLSNGDTKVIIGLNGVNCIEISNSL